MGRKGVSKRKARQVKSKPLTGAVESGSVSSLVRAEAVRPVKSVATDKAVSRKSS